MRVALDEVVVRAVTVTDGFTVTTLLLACAALSVVDSR